MQTPHTSTEWHVASTGNHQGLIIDEAGNNIAVAYDKQNAPLIAAAPELLAALENVLADIQEFKGEFSDLSDQFDGTEATVRVAILKAKGAQ